MGLIESSNGTKSAPASPPNTADHTNEMTLAWYTETPSAEVPDSLTLRQRNHRPQADRERLAATSAESTVAMMMIRSDHGDLARSGSRCQGSWQ